MRLVDLNPNWIDAGGEGVKDRLGDLLPHRHGVGLSFDCPCGCGERVAVLFENPLCGGRPAVSAWFPKWKRTGDDFSTLTLHPSILRMDGCRWHGWVTTGEVRTV